MKRLGAVVVLLVVLAAAQAADARRAHAATPRTLVRSGPSKAKSWAPEGKPALGDDLTIPAGKTLDVSSLLRAGSITEEPGATILGTSPIELTGSLTLEGSSSWEGVLDSLGIDRLSTGGNVLALIDNHGLLELMDGLHAAQIRTWGTLNTNSFPVRLAALYAVGNSFSNYGSSEVVAGQWETGNFNEQLGVWLMQMSAEATFRIVDDPNYPTTAVFRGGHWMYDEVSLEAIDAVESADSYQVCDDFVLNAPTMIFERGQTVMVGGDLAIGPRTTAIRSTESGHPYTLALPYDLEATTSATVSDMHVTGATLTLHGATDGGGNEGVVFY